MTKEEFFNSLFWMLVVLFVLGLVTHPFKTIAIGAFITLVASALAVIFEFFD